MAARKFAISVAQEVMEQVDSAAKRRGVTRSRFISDVLRRVARARSDAEITRRLNALFADLAITEEQRETAEAYRIARHPSGTEW